MSLKGFSVRKLFGDDRGTGWLGLSFVGAGLLLWLFQDLPVARKATEENLDASLGGIVPVLVPTLSQWGLLLLAMAMMGAAFIVIRRNSDSTKRSKR